ncbi:universal stress protein [Cellulomonas marina]|uniref:Nucleotide-binding universal stress protein, UspA family n=1 Tax=Cellulomonas marina TaxID=988821 RepID=A0A1I0W1E1_9CELL|nr:universal stress protein [Cellulomonas marina]GIG27406.1 universal stress protein [Cellulomonas marina]SFA82412.1 Nucleotide-binding universal stress protein, UspA family [Cellulomonas marina]
MSIVVGYVATPEGRAALDAAVAESRMRSLPVLLVASLGPDGDAGGRAALEDELAEVGRRLEAEGVPHEVRVMEGGDVADDLISTAESTGAALVVLGLRRRSPVGKLILGVNAQRVLFDAPCPVLTAKPSA